MKFSPKREFIKRALLYEHVDVCVCEYVRLFTRMMEASKWREKEMLNRHTIHTTHICHNRQWKWQAERFILCWGANGALWYLSRYVYDNDNDGGGGNGVVATHTAKRCVRLAKKGEINIHIISTAWGTFVDTLELLLTCIYVHI